VDVGDGRGVGFGMTGCTIGMAPPPSWHEESEHRETVSPRIKIKMMVLFIY
jgi:hypothetical protein